MRRAAVLIASLACVAMASCARTVVDDPSDTSYDPRNAEAQLDFWHGLSSRSAVTNDEALHGFLILVDGADPNLTYASRVAALDERGWLPGGFDEAGDLALQRGTLATMLAHWLEIDGGLFNLITGKHPRYATRELVFRNLMAPGSELRVLSGAEFLGVMGRAQDYRATRVSRGADPDGAG